MARIRTIKPEFYSSPGIESLEFAWRILYIAMWNWADDTGRGTAEARELMGFAFPLDEDMTLGEFRRGLGEVRRVFGVTFYKVSGRAYYAIPAWDKHQKIDKRSGSKWPSPNDGLPYDPVTNSAPIQGVGSNSAETHECPPSIRRDMGAGTGEQGNRGTEDQGNSGAAEQTSVTLSDADAPDFDGEEFEAEEESPTEDEQATDGYPEDFKRFWAIYPRRAGKGAACASFIKAKKRAKVEAIIAGAERLRDDPNLPEGSLIAHPSTWLNQDRWEDDPMPPRSDLSKSDQRLQQGFDLVQRVAARSEETYNYDPFAGKAIEQ